MLSAIKFVLDRVKRLMRRNYIDPIGDIRFSLSGDELKDELKTLRIDFKVAGKKRTLVIAEYWDNAQRDLFLAVSLDGKLITVQRETETPWFFYEDELRRDPRRVLEDVLSYFDLTVLDVATAFNSLSRDHLTQILS